MQIDCKRPSKLYRYSERKWLERSIKLGEFRLRPASDYKSVEKDTARNDDELVRIRTSKGADVVITDIKNGRRITPIGDVTYRLEVGTNYLTICFSKRWDVNLFDEFPGTDACLIIHDVEDFCERLHMAAEAKLPNWAGVDAAVSYGRKHPLGAVFTKPPHPNFVVQDEWRFAWRPTAALFEIEPVLVNIGNIEGIAEIVGRPIFHE